MLEGLQSCDSAVRSLTQSWVRTAVSDGGGKGTHRLLQPLVKILLESDTKRKQREDKLAGKKITLSRWEAEKDAKYASYYFKSLGIENPYLASTKDQYVEMVQHYSQVFDTDQILSALSLLQLAVCVDPFHLICNMGDTVIDVSMYTSLFGQQHGSASHAPRYHGEAESPTTPVSPSSPASLPSLSAHKSLLEVVLSTCVDLLCSEYHSSLKVSLEEQVENAKVKIGSASLLSVLLDEILKVLCKHGSIGIGGTQSDESSSGGFKVYSLNFVSALLTLCDIQKVSLLLLGKSVEWWLDFSSPFSGGGGGGSGGAERPRKGVWSELGRQWQLEEMESSHVGDHPGVVLRALFSHLLRLVQCLVSLDTRFSQSLPILTTPQAVSTDLVTVLSGVRLTTGGSDSLPAVSPSCATASQPFFREFVLQVLSSPQLSSAAATFHDDLLHVFSAALPNMLSQQIAELAPRVVKQLCGNIEGSVGSQREDEERSAGSRQAGNGDAQLCVLYFDAVLSTAMWCLFGDQPHPLQKGEGSLQVGGAGCAHHRRLKLHHRSSNPFYSLTRVKQVESARENFSPMNKQPSAMAWLLGVFTAQKIIPRGGGAESEGVAGEGGTSRVGVDSQVGQQVSMLLPAVYNSMTDMWVELQTRVEEGGVVLGGRGEGVASGRESMETGLLRKQNMVFEVSSVLL